MVKLYIPSRIRQLVKANSVLNYEALTLKDLLQQFLTQYPESETLLMQDEKLNAYTRAFINQKICLDLNQPLSSADEVYLIQAMAGG